ncbi:superoxide dismutase [Loigolactobacillus bifermentans]|uniref:Superoxide dismutase n=1 Tax=Loigolactobacillus bifermentans DSM 20003 TaxID=1423726 RepID=A0A0R1H6N9_9LACO|nr:superoxide dismutase [Loigolactobacillus bifermentans]KRK39604.1 superoxide dismutase [Loigolactobacillus bifermentans DSM 20003]QGG60772.1 superoxide dismutase [Loigolactobacillus bifermentans]
MTFTLPELSYPCDALEPYIDEATMRLHHDKHHQTYVDKLNATLKDNEQLANLSIEQLLQNLNTLPENIQTSIRNNGGGHYNHSIFWKMLTPNVDSQPSKALLEAIDETFGSYDQFKQAFTDAALSVFGSGWTWLIREADNSLNIVTTKNQDSPLTNHQVPLLGLDVWEHAYYLKYQNRRPEYINNFWHVVNWDEVNRRMND